MPAIRNKYQVKLAETLSIDSGSLAFVELFWNPDEEDVRVNERVSPRATGKKLKKRERQELIDWVRGAVAQLDDDGVVQVAQHLADLGNAIIARQQVQVKRDFIKKVRDLGLPVRLLGLHGPVDKRRK